MSEEPKDIIRFIDSKYKTLFFLPNGENIIVTRPDGERLTRSCRFWTRPILWWAVKFTISSNSRR